MSQFPAPPIRSPFPQVGNETEFSRTWVQWFQAVTTQFNQAPIVVTGSRGGNVALTSLLKALEQLGIVTDSTVP